MAKQVSQISTAWIRRTRDDFGTFLDEKVISADKMMTKAKRPVWHKKQKENSIIPKGIRGLDRLATWCKSNADGWVYGHVSFSFTSHRRPILVAFYG